MPVIPINMAEDTIRIIGKMEGLPPPQTKKHHNISVDKNMPNILGLFCHIQKMPNLATLSTCSTKSSAAKLLLHLGGRFDEKLQTKIIIRCFLPSKNS
jgi:hypothetical protein